MAALAGRTRNGGVDHREVLNMSTEFHLSLAGLPVILRDLLAKLPFHQGPLPDVDGFVRHVKSVILPPRPEPEDALNDESELDLLVDEDAVHGVSGAPAWLGKHARDDADVDADDTADSLVAGLVGGDRAAQAAAAAAAANSASKDEDVFRMRKRTRKGI
jgi:hypothetical protein